MTIYEVGEILILLKKKEERINNKEGIIFCDPRTSGLFDATQFEIIENREAWGSMLQAHETLTTDPDVLTQTLREFIE